MRRPTLIAFGAGGAFVSRLVTGTIAFTNTAFGRDPLPNVMKGCYSAPAGGPAGSASCATEGSVCTPGSAATVLFGARGAVGEDTPRRT